MVRYGGPMGRLANDSARGEAFSAKAAEVLTEAFPSLSSSAAIRDRQNWRDGELAALDAHLSKRRTKD
jgi:hypothetical protein